MAGDIRSLPQILSQLGMVLAPSTVAATPPFMPAARTAPMGGPLARRPLPGVIPQAPASGTYPTAGQYPPSAPQGLPTGPPAQPILLGGPEGEPIPANAPPANVPQKQGILSKLSDPRLSAFLLNAGGRMLMPRQFGETGAMQVGQGLISGYQGLQMLSVLQQEQARQQREEARKNAESQATIGLHEAQAKEAAGRGTQATAEAAAIPKREERMTSAEEFKQTMDSANLHLNQETLAQQRDLANSKLDVEKEANSIHRQQVANDYNVAQRRAEIAQGALDETIRNNKSETAIQQAQTNLASRKADAEIVHLRAQAEELISRPGQIDKVDIERLRARRQILSNLVSAAMPKDKAADIIKKADELIGFVEKTITTGPAQGTGTTGTTTTAPSNQGTRPPWSQFEPK